MARIKDVQAIANTAIKPPSKLKTADLFVSVRIKQSAMTEERNKEIPTKRLNIVRLNLFINNQTN